MTSTQNKPIILASTSPYRKQLLDRIGLKFTCKAPGVDEDAEKAKKLSPLKLAQTLAHLKAQSLADKGHCVIGGDQVAAFRGQIMGKPHTRERAIETLQALQGQTHELITSMCVIANEKVVAFTDITKLKMRPLDKAQIERYVDLDLPFDCAGGYKIEQAGISLFEAIHSDDFSAIQGVPLLKLIKVLGDFGYVIP